MVMQLLAIWAIVIATLIWFVRDEKRRSADADIALAARYYAHVCKDRHAVTPSVPLPLPPRRARGLSEQQRAYFHQLTQR